MLFELVVEVGLGGGNEFSKFGLVLRSDVLKSEDGSLLLVNDSSHTGLVLNDDVGDTHLSTEGWNENDEFDGVDIVSNDDEVGFLILDEGNAVVETHLDEERLLSVFLWLLAIVGGNSGGFLVYSRLFLLLGFRAVLV